MKTGRCFEHPLRDALVVIVPVLGDNFSYLLVAGDRAAAVDPADAAPLLEQLDARGLKLEWILNTHHHFDHVAGNEELKARTGCRVAGPGCAHIPGLDQAVADGDRLSVGRQTIEVIGTPGHTRSHLCYYLPSGAALWTGDTLFTGGCGRLIEGGSATMWGSLHTLAMLPDETLVFCGHDYAEENLQFAALLQPDHPAIHQRLVRIQALIREGKATVPSTLAEEKATNPFLRADTPELMQRLGLAGKSAADVFAELRHRKDLFA
ncbi:MAG TPA: hydroxyacylglutathione hydrolase [Kiritimatiellia bacterium]|nr:hydroxyacylglutathione hydrolase [Kiritimatiellia bacterium]HRZ13290.1 hydroxyacylglutathione hydrolase [Kiritimatiellia bacterium]HSA18739.1 hydroxyacylglutathione hydrolase [Kiritimatiellia bacterium]